MKPLKIKLHSFVDLITNSSTEIYIEATERTLASVKELVNDLLILTDPGTKLTADDLFTFELEDEEDQDDYNNYPTRSLIIKAKEESQERAVKIAKVLSNLTGLFSMEACYNG